MLLLEELKLDLANLISDIKQLYNTLELDKAKETLEELHMRATSPDFWDDAEKSQATLQKTGLIEAKIEKYNKLLSSAEDCLTMIDLYIEEDDESSAHELDKEVESIKAQYESLNLTTLLTGEYDAKNAIITFHAGAGGTEAQDWAQMLYRMYGKWSDKHGFKMNVLDYLDGDEAGMKSASVIVEGENAYGFLKSENGVHRLVRISPFDASGRRHTSFASLEILPEIDDSMDVEIKPEDIKMDVFRASGAGGQHINKTSSAVRLTHIPTGIVVSCQTQRSQVQNREYAMRMLTSKLIEIKEREHLEKIDDIKGVQKEIAWGAQIRSYVFMPYTLVKDHRTGFETGNINAVMDGDLDGFIDAYLVNLSQGKIEK